MIKSVLQPNDWQIKKFFRTVMTIQVCMLGLVGLRALGFNVPILRQVIGFIYLTFIPGIIILRILKLHKLGIVETVLYSVGISVAFDMFVGLIINSLYPHFGITNPISIWPLICTITAIQVFLLVLACKRDGNFSISSHFNWRNMFSLPVLLLVLLPLLAALGAEIVNVFHSNILLMVIIPFIAIIPVLMAFNKFISRRFYVLALLVVALALLFQNTLISRFLTGSDIRIEYYFANLVNINSYWNSSISNSYNAMLSVVMLAPMYSKICNVDLTYVFKTIYPIIFSLVPIGIYEVCRRQISARVAFISAFFFVSVATFYLVITSTARQQIAELYLILIILLMVNKTINLRARRILILLFGSALVVSHYGVSYIFMFLLITSLFILFLSGRLFVHVRARESGDNVLQNTTHARAMKSVPPTGNRTITMTFVFYFILAGLSWYILQSGSVVFYYVVLIGNKIATGFISEFFRPGASEALSILMTVASPLREVNKYLQLFLQFLIAIGIFNLLIHWKRQEFDEEYSAFALGSFALAAAAIVVPYLSGALNTERLYHITLIFLAPFCVIGAIVMYRLLSKKRGEPWFVLKFMSLLLAVFLVFNTGFVYEMAQNNENSISLSQNSIIEHGNAEEKVVFYANYSPDQDVLSAEWISKYTSGDSEIYATFTNAGGAYPLQSYGMISQERMYPLTPSTQDMQKLSYVYLQTVNVVDHLGMVVQQQGNEPLQSFNMEEISPLLSKADKIYSNGSSDLLYNNAN